MVTPIETSAIVIAVSLIGIVLLSRQDKRRVARERAKEAEEDARGTQG